VLKIHLITFTSSIIVLFQRLNIFIILFIEF